MKSLDLLKAVGQIDEKFIEEADSFESPAVQGGVRQNRRARRDRPVLRRWISVAASLAVVVGIGAFALSGGFAGRISRSSGKAEDSTRQGSDYFYSMNTYEPEAVKDNSDTVVSNSGSESGNKGIIQNLGSKDLPDRFVRDADANLQLNDEHTMEMIQKYAIENRADKNSEEDLFFADLKDPVKLLWMITLY